MLRCSWRFFFSPLLFLRRWIKRNEKTIKIQEHGLALRPEIRRVELSLWSYLSLGVMDVRRFFFVSGSSSSSQGGVRSYWSFNFKDYKWAHDATQEHALTATLHPNFFSRISFLNWWLACCCNTIDLLLNCCYGTEWFAVAHQFWPVGETVARWLACMSHSRNDYY